MNIPIYEIENNEHTGSSTTKRSGFNDSSIKIYSSKKQAEEVAKRFNEVSNKKGYSRFTNWKAIEKWW